MLRIGMLTSGGDCQSLNAAMRGVAKALYSARKDVKIIGFEDGYKGLIYGKYREMSDSDFSGILTEGGTILGSSRQPFKLMRVPDENGLDKVKAMKDNYAKLKLDCLVILGGNGTQKTANLLREEGLNIVSLPKTIDNDLWGTDITFGFQSAVDVKKLEERNKKGKNFSILAVAEGAISKEDAALPKKELKKKLAENPYPSVSYKIGKEIEQRLGQEVRITVPGHTQRGGSPCPYDRVLSTMFGAEAARLILNKEFGKMVAMKNNEITSVPLEEIAGKLKTIDPECAIIRDAKVLGIGFGD